MKVHRLGFVSVMAIVFVLGGFLSAWSDTQKEEKGRLQERGARKT